MIYIDLGVNVPAFIEKYLQTHTDPYYGFEPLPYLAPSLIALQSKYSHFKFMPYAAWNKDEPLTLYPNGGSCQGSTVVTGKCKCTYQNKVIVTGIDIVKWINTLPKEEKLLLKVDIEGAEYVVMPHIISAGLLPRIAQVRVEYHGRKINNPITAQHKFIVDSLKNIPVLPY